MASHSAKQIKQEAVNKMITKMTDQEQTEFQNRLKKLENLTFVEALTGKQVKSFEERIVNQTGGEL